MRPTMKAGRHALVQRVPRRRVQREVAIPHRHARRAGLEDATPLRCRRWRDYVGAWEMYGSVAGELCSSKPRLNPVLIAKVYCHIYETQY